MTTYNLATLLEESAQKYPERTAVVLARPGGEATRLSYAEVDAFANMVANLLVSLNLLAFAFHTVRSVRRPGMSTCTCTSLPAPSRAGAMCSISGLVLK